MAAHNQTLDLQFQGLQPIPRCFTTIEGYYEVRDDVYTLEKRSLTLSSTNTLDLEQGNDDKAPLIAMNKAAMRDGGQSISLLREYSSNKGQTLAGARGTAALEKPYHVYSAKQKWTVIILIGVAGLFSGLSSNIYFPSIDAIAKDLNVGIQDINLTITSYLIVQGISPLFWSSLSDTIGRRPIYIYSFMVYIVSNIALSFSPNFTVLLLFRGLQAAGSASTVSIGNGVIQDITTTAERGGFMSFYQAIRNFSIAAGPVLGGVLANFLGFRSIFIFLLILSSMNILVIIVFLPETLRSIAGDGSRRLTGIHQPLIRRLERRPGNFETQDSYVRSPVTLRTFVEPLLLLKRKEILLNLIFGGVIYAIWSMVTSSTTTLFKQIFFLNELELGFVFVPNGLGTIFGSTVIGILMNRSYKQAEDDYSLQHDMEAFQKLSTKAIPADFPIEKARLQHIPWIVALFMISTAAYGFSLGSPSLTGLPGWIAVPLILQFLIAATSNAVFAINQTLVMDLCPGEGASSTAVNNLLRCSMGAGGVALIDGMITGIGVGPTFAGLGVLTIAVYPLCIVQRYWSIDWRLMRTSSEEQDLVGVTNIKR